MSRLSIKPPMRPRLGIALGATSLAAARLLPADGGWTVEWARHASLPAALFSGEPQAHHESALAEALNNVVGEAARGYQPVYVALPDAAASFAVFALDALPAGDAARLDLVRWSFENDRHLRADDLACAYQTLGVDDGKHLLYACAHDKRWLAAVIRAFEQAGVVPWAINSAAGYYFNLLQSRIGEEPGSGAVVIVGLQAWTLIVWDGGQRPRLIRSRWLEDVRAGAADGIEALAREIERTLQAYVRGDERRAVSRLYLSGKGLLAEELGQMLDARAQAPITRIDLHAGLAWEEIPALETHPALVAAVEP